MSHFYRNKAQVEREDRLEQLEIKMADEEEAELRMAQLESRVKHLEQTLVMYVRRLAQLENEGQGSLTERVDVLEQTIRDLVDKHGE